MAFPQLALHQMQEGRGLKAPSFNTSRLRGKEEREKGKKKPLTLTLYPFPQTRFRVKNAKPEKYCSQFHHF